MKLKELIKSFIPPIAYSIKRKFFNVNDKPSWHKIKGGIVEGLYFFTNESNSVFKSMINGDYDDFFWEYLNNIKLNLDSSTVIDIGAHIGFHTLSFAKLVGARGQVMSFEPNPFNIERLKMNIKKNLPISERISVHSFALGDSSGIAAFNFSTNVDNMTSSGGFLDGVVNSRAKSAYKAANFVSKKIQVVTLDQFAKENKIESINLIKIDVEGAEGIVLKGGVEVLRKFKPVLMIEIHNVTAMLDVCKIILPMGYVIKVLQIDRPSRCFIGANVED